MVTTFFVVEPNMYGSSVYNLLNGTHVAPEIFMWLLGFWKICVPFKMLYTSTDFVLSTARVTV